MQRLPSNTLRAFAFGSAVAVLSALLCLACAASRDARGLSLDEFTQRTRTESVLMSCADAAGFSSAFSHDSSADPLWCSDPTSPRCRPAAPPSTPLELSDPSTYTLLAAPEAVAELAVSLALRTPYPRPEASSLRSLCDVHRLERPPRA